MTLEHLSQGAIDKAHRKHDIPKGSVFQVAQIQRSEDGKSDSKAALSDGKFIMTVRLTGSAAELIKSDAIKQFCLARINSSNVKERKGRIIVEVDNWEFVCDCASLFGEPEKYKEPTETLPVKKIQPIDLDKKHEKFYDISGLSNFLPNFTIRARVTKGFTKDISLKSGEQKKNYTIVLTDDTGEIQGSFWGEDAEKFINIIEVNKVYVVSGGKIKYANKGFNSTSHLFEIAFDKRTKFTPYDEGEELKDFGKVKYHFRKLSDIEKLKANKQMDVVAVIVEVSNVETISTKKGDEVSLRRVVICDDSNVKVELTLFNKDVNIVDNSLNKVIVVSDARIYEYNGKKSLSLTQNASKVLIDPDDFPEVQKLLDWYKGGEVLGELKTLAVTTNTPKRATPIVFLKHVAASELENIGQGVFFDVHAILTDLLWRKKPYYYACSNENCKNKGVNPRDDGSFFCERCNTVIDHPRPRYMLSFKISDFSATADISAFGDDEYIKKVIGYNAKDFKNELDNLINEQEDENGENEDDKESCNNTKLREKLINPRLNYLYRFRVRAAEQEYKGNQEIRYNVQNAFSINFAEGTKLFAAEITKYCKNK